MRLGAPRHTPLPGRAASAILLAFWIGAWGGTSAAELADARKPCTDSNRPRKPYFGELHVHTTFFLDAQHAGHPEPTARRLPLRTRCATRGAALRFAGQRAADDSARTTARLRRGDGSRRDAGRDRDLPDAKPAGHDRHQPRWAGRLEAGELRERVHEVAGDPTNGARVDLEAGAGPAAATSTAFAPCGPIPTPLRSDASQDGSGARVELADLVHAR